LTDLLPDHPVGPGDRSTKTYMRWNPAATCKHTTGLASVLWFTKLDNLTSVLADSTTSILATTAFPKSPCLGRILKDGLQAASSRSKPIR